LQSHNKNRIAVYGQCNAVYAFLKAKSNPDMYDGNNKLRFNGKRCLKAFINAVPALIMPLIIIGGILSGVFTATEAGAIAGLYGLLIGVFL
jgi:C4-dicarboxylate transporter DctM subunit